jgi:BlaI family penicillinase repressor
MKTIKISDAEWQVMNLLWERSPLAAAEVVAALQTKSDWRPRTIRTLLDRLARKGAVRERSDGVREYEPAVTQAACIRRESHSFAERVFGGEPASMLLHLIKEAKLTRQEISQLKQLLSEKEK